MYLSISVYYQYDSLRTAVLKIKQEYEYEYLCFNTGKNTVNKDRFKIIVCSFM